LRNAALGRGVAPVVPVPLATEVGTAYDQWRGYLDSKPTWTAEVVPELATTWLVRYRALAPRVAVAVPSFRPVAFGAVEQTVKAAGAVMSAAKGVLILLGVVVAPALVLLLLSKARR
jgi:hypothetical protein